MPKNFFSVQILNSEINRQIWLKSDTEINIILYFKNYKNRKCEKTILCSEFAEIIDTHINLRRLKHQELKSPLTRLKPTSCSS